MISLIILLPGLLGLLLIPMPVAVESFHLDSSNSNNFVRGTTRIRQHQQYQQPQQQQYTTVRMCICINCQLVTSCKAYHFVETKHEQPHMTNTPTFLPREGSPTINVNIRTEQIEKQIENDDGEQKDDEDDSEDEYNNEDEDEIIKRQRSSSSSSMWKDQIQQQQHDDSSSSHITTPAINNNNNDADVLPIDVASSDSKSISKTTIEYDVVKCEDFILDKNCWIINMPEEIKRLNPDFVPS
ncbi:chloroplast protein Ycf34 [Fragilariopsis cylindrus CCMP1102]|uniref:Chloroplast protein Ycf34 n=1 Tax=Fragilariopsis cylindrus CCMP1102 TaxID=635003 RepID=A0A1E7ENU9_9STRA|nr:chloroplast protein Ycf34 [Fragilariopsis cylindrus CCMP1102]|eukprot:OEU07447.1 chloroplast protein Ycf34 [Fragilariopsis cylindrus CCMP1102]